MLFMSCSTRPNGMKTARNCAVGVLAIAREQGASTEARILENGERIIMKWGLFVPLASILLFTIAATAQEVRNEVSVQGTGFFTKDSNGNGISRTTTKTGGLEVGYRYHINRWLAAEANYGFDRNTQKYFLNAGQSRIQSDVHGAT